MKVFAHRGSSLLWPENTLEAFRRADELGAQGFETDLRLSRDGRIVLVHDPDLDRLGSPGVVVAERSAEQLAEAVVRSRDGTLSDRVITLEQLLVRYPTKDYIFDCKIDDRALFEELARLLDRLRFHDRICFLTWSRDADRHLARYFPGAPQFPGIRRSTLWGIASALRIGRAFEPAHGALSLPAHQGPLKVISAGQVASLERRGKRFMGYLVNDERDLARARACGVTEVLTDRPDLVLGGA